MSSNTSNQSSFLLLKTLFIFILVAIGIMLVYRFLGYDAFTTSSDLKDLKQRYYDIWSGMEDEAIRTTAIKKVISTSESSALILIF